jgi:short-subunit dehydrogenase
VVALSETLYQDLSLMTDQIHASVLCPYFVPTGIAESHRHRPDDMKEDKGPSPSQLIGRAMAAKAVTSGKVTAQTVAQSVFDALRDNHFYIYSHPDALAGVQVRMEDIMQRRNPTSPFSARPEVEAELRKTVRAAY